MTLCDDYARHTGKWVKKIVPCGGVFNLAVEQPQLFRKLHNNKN